MWPGILLCFLAPAVIARPDPIKRQTQATKPDSSSSYTLSTTATGNNQCLFPILGVDGSVPYPVRFSPCDSLQYEKSWQFVPDGAGRYFVYNKAWPGTSNRLDIHCPEPTLCIMWMGPSDPKYNNQRWSLQSDGAESVKISSLGLPGWFLTSGTADGDTVAFLQNDTTASSGKDVAWRLNTVAASVTTTTSSTEAEKPTVVPPATTPPLSSSETKAATLGSTTSSTATSASTGSISADSFQAEGAPTSQKSNPAPTASSTSTSTPETAKDGGGDEKHGGMSETMIGVIVSVVGIVVSIIIGCFAAPATTMRLLTCGRRYRKRTNKQMRGDIRMSGIRLLPWTDGRDAGKVAPWKS